jgi:hypothetical protein
MIPGIVTSGLELWSGEECAKSYFRQRMCVRTTRPMRQVAAAAAAAGAVAREGPGSRLIS